MLSLSACNAHAVSTPASAPDCTEDTYVRCAHASSHPLSSPRVIYSAAAADSRACCWPQVQIYAQCGGLSGSNKANAADPKLCCPSSTSCRAVNDWYWQCLPGGPADGEPLAVVQPWCTSLVHDGMSYEVVVQLHFMYVTSCCKCCWSPAAFWRREEQHELALPAAFAAHCMLGCMVPFPPTIDRCGLLKQAATEARACPCDHHRWQLPCAYLCPCPSPSASPRACPCPCPSTRPRARARAHPSAQLPSPCLRLWWLWWQLWRLWQQLMYVPAEGHGCSAFVSQVAVSADALYSMHRSALSVDERCRQAVSTTTCRSRKEPWCVSGVWQWIGGGCCALRCAQANCTYEHASGHTGKQ